MAQINPTLPTVGSDKDVWGTKQNAVSTAVVTESNAQDLRIGKLEPPTSAVSGLVPTTDGLGGIGYQAPAAGATVVDATPTVKGIVQLAGALAGTASAPALAGTGVGAGTYGGATAVPIITVGPDGRVSSIGTVPPAAGGTAATSDAVSAGGYGVVADGLFGKTGTMTAGSTTLTFTTGGLVQATHAGAVVRVTGAGASGAVLVTTIASVTDGTHAVLASAATTAVTNGMVLIGHDNNTAINNAVTAAAGKKLTFPRGTYYISGNSQTPAAGIFIDGSGATFLNGGFYLGNKAEIENASFVGDASGAYATNIWVSNSGTTNDGVVRNCSFSYGNWGILRNDAGPAPIISRWRFENNTFDQMQTGCFHVGNMVDSHFTGNISTNIKTGCNTYEFGNVQQRNYVQNNIVNGGRAGIVFLWAFSGVAAPTATQGWDVFGNSIVNNRVIGQTEEGISFDSASAGSNTFDNAVVSAVSTSSKTVTLTASAWSTAGSKWQYSHLYVLNGNGIGQMHRITAQSNALLTLGEADATDLAKIASGDSIVIGAPIHHNVVAGNYVDGRQSTTFSIYLYTLVQWNTVSNNTTLGAPIGTGSTNSMAAVTGSITGSVTSAPACNNVFTGNVCTGQPQVAPGYFNAQPGIHFLYLNYASLTDFFSVGNIAAGNIIRGGYITLQRNERLLASNVVERGITVTNAYTGVSTAPTFSSALTDNGDGTWTGGTVTGYTKASDDTQSAAATSAIYAAATAMSGVSSQSSAAYTFVLPDAGDLIRFTGASATTVTIPTDASVLFPTGTVLKVLQSGTGQITVVGASGVTLRAGGGAKSSGQYASIAATKLAANEWLVEGSTTT